MVRIIKTWEGGVGIKGEELTIEQQSRVQGPLYTGETDKRGDFIPTEFNVGSFDAARFLIDKTRKQRKQQRIKEQEEIPSQNHDAYAKALKTLIREEKHYETCLPDNEAGRIAESIYTILQRSKNTLLFHVRYLLPQPEVDENDPTETVDHASLDGFKVLEKRLAYAYVKDRLEGRHVHQESDERRIAREALTACVEALYGVDKTPQTRKAANHNAGQAVKDFVHQLRDNFEQAHFSPMPVRKAHTQTTAAASVSEPVKAENTQNNAEERATAERLDKAREKLLGTIQGVILPHEAHPNTLCDKMIGEIGVLLKEISTTDRQAALSVRR